MAEVTSTMGVYERVVFNALMELNLDRASVRAERRLALAAARGEILEVGIGTGLNIPCYPDHVRRITATQLDDTLDPRAERRRAQRDLHIDLAPGNAERLPFADASFDTIVSTFLLCSIHDPAQAVREFRRVLKPDGALLFLEHVRSPRTATRVLQTMINPLHVVAACGCSLLRDTAATIRDNGFALRELVAHDIRRVLAPYRHMIRGVALPVR